MSVYKRRELIHPSQIDEDVEGEDLDVFEGEYFVEEEYEYEEDSDCEEELGYRVGSPDLEKPFIAAILGVE